MMTLFSSLSRLWTPIINQSINHFFWMRECVWVKLFLLFFLDKAMNPLFNHWTQSLWLLNFFFCWSGFWFGNWIKFILYNVQNVNLKTKNKTSPVKKNWCNVRNSHIPILWNMILLMMVVNHFELEKIEIFQFKMIVDRGGKQNGSNIIQCQKKKRESQTQANSSSFSRSCYSIIIMSHNWNIHFIDSQKDFSIEKV